MTDENTLNQDIELTHEQAVALAAAEQAHLGKKRVRKEIAETAGDQMSLLGTAADGATMAIYGIATICAKLSTAQSLEEVRAAAAPFAALSASFLAKVDNGEVKLPFLVKGTDSVVADIETRSTAVANALGAAQGSSESA